MFDVARAVSVLFALAAWARTRDVVGGVALAVMAALFACDVGIPLAAHATGDSGAGSGFGLVLLGPTILTPRPVLLLVEGLAGIAASRASFRRARPLRPETEGARAWDRAGLRFLFAATLAVLLLLLELLLERLVPPV